MPGPPIWNQENILPSSKRQRERSLSNDKQETAGSKRPKHAFDVTSIQNIPWLARIKRLGRSEGSTKSSSMLDSDVSWSDHDGGNMDGLGVSRNDQACTDKEPLSGSTSDDEDSNLLFSGSPGSKSANEDSNSLFSQSDSDWEKETDPESHSKDQACTDKDLSNSTSDDEDSNSLFSGSYCFESTDEDSNSLFSQSDSDWEKEMDSESHSKSNADMQLDIRNGERLVARRGYTAIVPPTLSKIRTCSFMGFVCNHESHINSAEGSFPWPKISTCAIISAFHIHYSVFGFVCHEHHTIIHPRHILRHLKRTGHRIPGKHYTKAVLLPIQDHIFRSHGISNEEVEFLLPNTPLRLDIPGLIPILAYQCPVNGCSTFRRISCDSQNRISTNGKTKNLWSHVSTMHGAEVTLQLRKAAVVLERRYIIQPFMYSGMSDAEGRNLVLPYADDYVPHVITNDPGLEANVNFQQLPAPISAEWLNELGWGVWVQKTGADIEVLRKLVEIPKESCLHSSISKTDPQPRHRLEIGMLFIHQMLDGYLQDANTFIDEKHGDLRAEVTAGSHAHYRSLQSQSYSAYRRPLTMTVLLLLRMFHLGASEDGDVLRQLGQFPKMLWDHINADQLESIFNLHKYIVTDHGQDMDPVTLLNHTHTLLSNLVRYDIESADKIACATDITLLLGSLLPEGLYQCANSISKDCAMLCHGMMAVIIHFTRLQDSQASGFLPHNISLFQKQIAKISAFAEDDTEGGTCEAIVDDEGNIIENDEVIDEDLETDLEASDLDAETQTQDLEPDEDHLTGSQQYRDLLMVGKDRSAKAVIQPSIFSLLAKERDSFLRPMTATPYGHCKFVWFKVAKAARTESRSGGFTFMDDGQGVIINDASGRAHQLPFSLLGSLARCAISLAEESIIQCLPKDCVNDFRHFQWQSLTDNLTSDQSLFRQPQNQQTLQPVFNRLLCALLGSEQSSNGSSNKPLLLTRKGQLDFAKARKWLESHDTIISSSTAAFILTCGIPPRSFQFRFFQVDHDAAKGYKRNFFIVDKLPALANPQAKQRDRRFMECLWGVTSAQAHSLLYFLGVLKPLYSAVMRRIHIQDPEFDIYIFVHSMPQPASSRQRQTTRLLSGTAINYALYRHTSLSGTRLTCSIMRNTMTAVYRQFFPWLVESTNGSQDRSPVDWQGQHSTSTSTAHYGRILDIPHALNMPRDKAIMYVKISRTLQAVYNLALPDDGWSGHQQSPYLLAKLHEAAAFSKAQALICIHYGVGGDYTNLEDCNRNEKRVNDILDAAPYLLGPTSQALVLAPPALIGDRVLIQVVHILAYGVHGPPPFSRPPPGGHHMIFPATAVKLIIKALEEWRDGYHQSLDFPLNRKLGEHFDSIQAKAYQWFCFIRSTHNHLWLATSEAIHNFNGVEERSDVLKNWVARGVPSVPST